MYTISLFNQPLFDPRLIGYSVIEPTLECETNKISTLTFTIYPNNPQYGNIECYKSILKVYRDGALIGIQQPVRAERAFQGGITYTCEDILGRLNRINVVPSIGGSGIAVFIGAICSRHNERFSDFTMTVGTVSQDLEEDFSYSISEYMTLWEALEKHLFDKAKEAYLVASYSNSGVTLSYLAEDDLPLCSQTVELGKNMLDMERSIDDENFFTVLIPLGKDGVVTDKKSRKMPVGALNISTVNDGSIYLVDADGVAEYGWKERIETFSDEAGQELEDASQLLAAAQKYMADNANLLPDLITLNAADLHNSNIAIQAIPWPCRIRTISSAHDMDAIYPTRRMKIPLGNPDSSSCEITIGTIPPTLTDAIYSNEEDVIDSLRGLNGRGSST